MVTGRAERPNYPGPYAFWGHRVCQKARPDQGRTLTNFTCVSGYAQGHRSADGFSDREFDWRTKAVKHLLEPGSCLTV
jgi:hypothetical protein